MIKSELIKIFTENHLEAAEYIVNLSDDELVSSTNGKWSPAQQLEHLILCIQPISQALASPAYIENKFGTQQREAMSREQVLAVYKKGLEDGGKAPERFLPQTPTAAQRSLLMQEMNAVLNTIEQQWADYSEEQLDRLVLPHPFLGLLSIRELFYLMSHHPQHHLVQVRRNRD